MLRTVVSVALAFIAALVPLVTFAQNAQNKDITEFSLKQWGLFLGMALLGGFVNWWGQVRRGEIPLASISTLIGELCTSAFAGLLAFFICEWANFPQLLSAALTGICGHMGTRALAMFEDWATRKFGSLVPAGPAASQPQAAHQVVTSEGSLVAAALAATPAQPPAQPPAAASK